MSEVGAVPSHTLIQFSTGATLMPHDQHGTELHVGDLVMVPCRVRALHLTEEYCNVDLVTEQKLFPTDSPTFITLNAKQTVKA